MLNLNKDILEGKWLQVRGELRDQWGKLTHDDLERIGGKRDKLEGTLRERYGFNKAKARSEVDSFLDRLADVRETVQDRVQDAQETVQSQVQSTQEMVEERASKARAKAASKKLEKKVDNLEKQLAKAEAQAEEKVEKYPWLVIAGAFLAGFVIGLMLSQQNGSDW